MSKRSSTFERKFQNNQASSYKGEPSFVSGNTAGAARYESFDASLHMVNFSTISDETIEKLIATKNLDDIIKAFTVARVVHVNDWLAGAGINKFRSHVVYSEAEEAPPGMILATKRDYFRTIKLWVGLGYTLKRRKDQVMFKMRF